MKTYTLIDLDNIDNEMLSKLKFNTEEEVISFLIDKYTINKPEIRITIQKFSLSDMLDFLNLEIQEK